MDTRTSVARILVPLWFGAMLILGAALLAKHVVELPLPLPQKLASSLSALRTPVERGKWLAVHVLYAECRCSQRIVRHLLSTTRPTDWRELVLWVGKGEPDPALDRHFRVQRITSSELSRLSIEAAPLLVVLDPGDGLRYSGGYSAQKQGPVLDDLRIFEESVLSGALAALPILGCATSDRLRQQLAIVPGL